MDRNLVPFKPLSFKLGLNSIMVFDIIERGDDHIFVSPNSFTAPYLANDPL